MNHETGVLTLLKSFLTKACFTVGLCTTAYWSVAKIHQSMNPSKPETAKTESSGGLREKVDTLNQDQNLGTVPAVHFAAKRRNHIQPTAEPEAAPAVPAPTSSESAPEQTAAASPSPSPGDAQVQGQEANNGELPTAEPFYPNPYAYHQAMADMVREEVARENGGKTSGSGGANATPENPYGQTTTGQLIKPPSGQVYGGVNLGNTGNTINVTSNLSQQDVQWLLAANLKATVPAQQVPVTAHKVDGSSAPNTSVWSNRWDLDEGVKPEAMFAIRSSSGSYPLQFEVNLTFESQNSTPLPVQFSVKPTESNAKNDVVNGRPVRLYTFSTSEITLRGNTSNSEAIKQVFVRLAFDVSGGTPVLVDGSFGFSRAGVKTDASSWDPTRAPAAVSDQLIVDQLPFSMKLEKSQ